MDEKYKHPNGHNQQSFCDTKLRDTPSFVKRPGLFAGAASWYMNKYVKTKSGMPYIHLMLAVGLFGYSLHYSHLSKTSTLDTFVAHMAVLVISPIVEHQHDENEKAKKEGRPIKIF